MSKLQYNGPDTDELKKGVVYDRSEHSEIDDELWCTPAFVEETPESEGETEAAEEGEGSESGASSGE